MHQRVTTGRCALALTIAAGACGEDRGGSTTTGAGSTTTAGASTGTSDTTTTDGPPTTGTASTGTTGATGPATTSDASTTGDTSTGSTGTGGLPVDPAIEMQCQDLSAAGQLDALCACYVQAGDYPDQDTCVAELAPPSGFVDCICSIYAMYPESSAYFDCITPVNQGYYTCVAAAACDQAALDACAAAAEADSASAQCGMPPMAALDAAVRQCADQLP